MPHAAAGPGGQTEKALSRDTGIAQAVRMQGLILLDYLGVALFAATGALAASRKQLDIVGFGFLAVLTGVGGGTVRDLILDVPVFRVGQPLYLMVCTGTAVVVFLGAHLLESRYRWLLWLDAAALAFGWALPVYKPRPGREIR